MKHFPVLLFFLFSGLMHAGDKLPVQLKPITSRDFVFGDSRPFKECHASTLIHLESNEYMIAWFGGTREKHPDIGIWMSKGKPGAWSAPMQVAKIRNDAHWNPVLFKDPENRIHLYFKVGKEITDWETWEIISLDKGTTWSEPRELVKGNTGGRGPVSQQTDYPIRRHMARRCFV